MKIEAVPLDELSQQVAACHACGLCEGRTNTVFGEGDPHAGIMLIGEAPGRYEDLPVSYTHLTLPTNSRV